MYPFKGIFIISVRPVILDTLHGNPYGKDAFRLISFEITSVAFGFLKSHSLQIGFFILFEFSYFAKLIEISIVLYFCRVILFVSLMLK